MFLFLVKCILSEIFAIKMSKILKLQQLRSNEIVHQGPNNIA